MEKFLKKRERANNAKEDRESSGDCVKKAFLIIFKNIKQCKLRAEVGIKLEAVKQVGSDFFKKIE